MPRTSLLVPLGRALWLRCPYPFSKTLWLALDLYFQPRPPEGTAKPGDDRRGD